MSQPCTRSKGRGQRARPSRGHGRDPRCLRRTRDSGRGDGSRFCELLGHAPVRLGTRSLTWTGKWRTYVHAQHRRCDHGLREDGPLRRAHRRCVDEHERRKDVAAGKRLSWRDPGLGRAPRGQRERSRRCLRGGLAVLHRVRQHRRRGLREHRRRPELARHRSRGQERAGARRRPVGFEDRVRRYARRAVSKHDRGNPWSRLALASGDVSDVAVEPGRSSTIYAHARWGLFRSTDRGQSWRLVMAASRYGGEISAIAFDPLTPGMLVRGNGHWHLRKPKRRCLASRVRRAER